MTDGAGIVAVAFDYGGVLTTPLGPGFAAWAQEEGVDPASLRAVLRDWLNTDGLPDNPLHRLETGRLSGPDFAVLLGERLSTVDRRPLDTTGLLDRMFGRLELDVRMLELAASLHNRGLATALLSNSWGNTYPVEVLDPLFDVTVISGEVGLRKPDPAIFHHTLTALGTLPAQTVFVDDLQHNVDAARAVGLHGILHTDHASTAAALTDLIPCPGLIPSTGPIPTTEEHPHA